MKKQLTAIGLAVLLTLEPVAAQQTPAPTQQFKSKQEFCQAVMGWDDIAIGAVIVYLALYAGMSRIVEWGQAREIERLKAKAKRHCEA